MCSVKRRKASPGVWMRELTTRRSSPCSPARSSSRRSKSRSLRSCSTLIESIAQERSTPRDIVARDFGAAFPPVRLPPEAFPHPVAGAVRQRLRRLSRALRRHQPHHLPPARLGGRDHHGHRRLHAAMAVVSPVAGVLVDRWNVKRVMIGSDLIRAVLALLLVFTQDVRQIALIFASLAVVASFFAPAHVLTLRALVPVEDLLAANAMLSQAFDLVRIVSPALAGALAPWLTGKGCFYLDAGSFPFSGALV